MVNIQLLERKIKDSGLKNKYISGELGISEQAFYLKRTGKNPFKKLEIERLCEMLNIVEPEYSFIFGSET